MADKNANLSEFVRELIFQQAEDALEIYTDPKTGRCRLRFRDDRILSDGRQTD